MKHISLKSFSFLMTGLTLSLGLNGQDWMEVDTFPDGEPAGTWAGNGLPSVDTSAGYLDLRPTPESNVTSTFYVTLPQSFTEGKLTVAFDFYLPAGPELNMAGFGVGSLAQAAESGWSATGNRNRFQSVGEESPQNMAKVPEWSSDIFGTTEQGVWYNVWLVYDLDASPNTVTAVTKKASDLLEEGNLNTNIFDFNDANNDDWSSIDVFSTGVGLQDSAPAGTAPWDALGALFDNIYVSSGENLTMKPTSVEPEWEVVDTFTDGAPDATWTVDDGITAAFESDRLLVTGSAANTGLYTELPLATDLRQAFTVTFDMMLPAGSSGLNHVQFAVVGEEQVALTGASLFGGSDRFITFGVDTPQALANFGQWPPSLGPDLLEGTVQDQWYHVWLVYDGSSKTVDFYAVAFGDLIDALPVPAEPTGSFALETEYTDLSYLVVGVSQPGGDGMALDNIYQSSGRALSLSPTAGEISDGGGEDPVSLWVDVPTANAAGDKEAGIGWINDIAYPFIWHYSTGGWMFVLDDFSTLDNIWLYEYGTDVWYWANDGWGGWHVHLSDPEYGLGGWKDWTP